MSQQRSRIWLVACAIGVVVLLLLPALLTAQVGTTEPRASALCQMEYVDRTVDGRPGWEVVSITLGPDGGRLGAMYFYPGDVIVEIGGRPVEPGADLDTRIRMALLEQKRTVTLAHPITGARTIYIF